MAKQSSTKRMAELLLEWATPRELKLLFGMACLVAVAWYAGLVGPGVVGFWLFFGYPTIHIPYTLLRHRAEDRRERTRQPAS